MNRITQRMIIILLGIMVFQLHGIKKYLYNQCLVANGNTQSTTMNLQDSNLINSLSNIKQYGNNIMEYLNILSSLTK